jgi:hypothetical protein
MFPPGAEADGGDGMAWEDRGWPAGDEEGIGPAVESWLHVIPGGRVIVAVVIRRDGPFGLSGGTAGASAL